MDVEILEKKYKIIEDCLEQMDSIISARLALENKDATIEKIYIISNAKRNPKQLSRDIQSILAATYAIEVDYKNISIAELPCKELNKMTNRLKVEGVSYENKGDRASVTVNISNKEKKYSHSYEGLNINKNIDRMLVNATLRNIEKALGVDHIFILEDVASVSISIEKVVIAIIICAYGGEEKRMSGSCIVREDHKEAVVKATLDSINRYVLKQ